jgi:TolB-like protein
MIVHAEASAGGAYDLSAESSRTQLARVLNSTDFDATDRERRFLGYVVEEALAGRGHRIKAYSIAVEVFGRDISFDPQVDPIVRVEAGHLRRSLERYYLTAGQADPILITIPKGAYVPTFAPRSQPAPATPPPPLISPTIASDPPWRRMPLLAAGIVGALLVAAVATLALWWNPFGAGPSVPEIPHVLVETFDDLTGTEASAAISTGLRQEVVGQLFKFRDLVVHESYPTDSDSSIPAPRFVLGGSVNLSADAFRLRVRLVNRADGSVLWAESYDGGMNVAKLLDAQTDVALNVATTLAPTYGIIFSADSSRQVTSPPDDWTAYSCTLSFYAYSIVLDAKTRSSVRDCLEKTVERFPSYATAWGLLSLTYIDDHRFQFPTDPAASQAALQRALAAAKQAVDLDPRNVRGLHAQMLALYFNQDIDAALAVGKLALAINPNDTDLMGEYGSRLALSGNWPEGCAFTAEARRRHPAASTSYEVDLALCAYFSRDYPQAAIWIRKTTFPDNPVYHLVAAAVFGEGGYKTDAERESAWLDQNQPALVNNIRQVVSTRLARPEDVEFFISSLRKAGLQIKD